MPPFEIPSDFIAQFKSLLQQVADLAVRVNALGGRRDRGANTVVFSGAELSATRTVTHSLGAVPTAVVPASQQAGVTMTTSSFTDEDFVAQGFFPGGATGTFAFTWIAEL